MISPIGYIRTDFKEKFGLPRQSGRVEALCGVIVFNEEYRNIDSVRGLENFSHLWIIFDFSKAHRQKWSPTVRPPRLGGNKRVGVFASRSPFRPNNIGLSCVKIEKVVLNGEMAPLIYVSGVDILDNTPIYDIKPYIPYCDSVSNAYGSYSDEFKNHKLEVKFLNNLSDEIPISKREAIIGCLADDPRPAYHDDDRVYTMRFANLDISFKVEDNVLTVLKIKEITAEN